MQDIRNNLSYNSNEEPPEQSIPRDPEEAQRTLGWVQDLLQRREVQIAFEHRPPYHEIDDTNGARDAMLEDLLKLEPILELRLKLDDVHPADVAYVLESLPLDDRLIVWDLVKANRDGDILMEASDAVRETLISSMDREELVEAVESLDTDEIAELAPDLPSDVVEEVRQGLTAQEREQLRAAMSYAEGSVGARMDFDLVTVRADVSLEVVLRYMRNYEKLPDHTDQVFVVDNEDRLVGALPIQRLLVNEPEVMVEDVMSTEVLTLQGNEEVSEAAQAFERYDLVSAPVVDAHNRLVGRLTVAEVVDVIREEGDSDLLAQAGLREDEDIFSSVWKSAKNRWLWLALNLCTAFFASRVIGGFEGTIAKVVALAALMPIVAGIAGNSGNQTMTLFIRSLALGQVTAANARQLILKELAIAALNGIVWGSVAGLFAWWLYSNTSQGVLLGLIMMLAIILNLLVGALVGMLVPLALQKAGRDPALGSSVLLTFTTDSMGFFIFLGLASLFFR
jgi:magnesium transporter